MGNSTMLRLLPLLGALALAACGGGDSGDDSASAGPPVEGGTAVVGVLTDFGGFNPVTVSGSKEVDVMQNLLFAPLVRYDQKLNVQPYLAERWELTDTSVTFHLRGDVTWHDGKPVTAEDVKFTFDLAKDPAAASLLGSAFVNLVESATVIDPRTIRFTFSEPHAQALEDFWWAPLPKHLLEGVAAAELGQAPYNQNPVGNGPFRFVEWQRGQRLVLAANPNFPQELGGRPNLDQLVFRVIPEPTTMMTELLSGSADVIGWTLLPDQASQLQGQQGVELRHFPSREFTYVGWNNERPMFSDARVRRALTMSIDRPRMIEALLHGFGQPATGMIPPWSPMYTEAEPIPYDPAGARQLLAQAGWQDTNGDGVVERGGQPLRFNLMVNAANRMHQDIALVMQQGLREAGIGVEIRTMEFQSMLQQHKARDYDAVIANWTLDNFKVDPTPLFSCEQAQTPQSPNRAGYCNPRADQLMQQGLRATDAGQAKQVWAQFSQLLQQDQPITFLFWSEDMAAVGPRLRGAEMDVRSKLVNATEWFIPGSGSR